MYIPRRIVSDKVSPEKGFISAKNARKDYNFFIN